MERRGLEQHINVLHWGADIISQQVRGSGLYLVSGNDLVRDLNGPPSKLIQGNERAFPSPSFPCVVWAYTRHEP